MKYLVLITLFLTTSLFANYAYQGENSGKIDMHGGKGDSINSSTSKFKNPTVTPLGGISVEKPKSPFAPSALIKEEKKVKEKQEKKSTKTDEKTEEKESK